jgi:hypothetical protein
MGLPKDVGHEVQEGVGQAYYWTSGAGETEQTCATDRAGYSSGKVIVEWNAQAVTDKKKLTLTIQRYQSADNSNWDAAEVLQAATDVFTAATPVLAATGRYVFNQNFDGVKRYVRYGVTGVLNKGSVDTASYSLAILLGGSATLPTT